ncbi:hypothetical protein ACJIZ3_004005 [Penstemon smallii]|uniref:TRASH domain-containing protein n=2 Tax=Penstemon smallii TaxID=265156 RepID=A0ABD3S0U3_9LAMI
MVESGNEVMKIIFLGVWSFDVLHDAPFRERVKGTSTLLFPLHPSTTAKGSMCSGLCQRLYFLEILSDMLNRGELRSTTQTMVLKTELCRFSGAKIYPGRGIRFIRSDSQVFLFVNSKCKRYFHNRLRPAKLTWTAMYRKQHKKDVAAEAVKKRRRATKKPYSRSIVGATLEVIQKRRAEKPEVRDAAREAALREIKERIKKTKDEKKAKKAELMSKQKTSKSNVPKGAVPKGPKIGGGGGKR